MLEILQQGEIEVEYAELRDPLNWTARQPENNVTQARVFVAGNIEGVRLIDNMELGVHET
jgi:pantothenate synthetase